MEAVCVLSLGCVSLGNEGGGGKAQSRLQCVEGNMQCDVIGVQRKGRMCTSEGKDICWFCSIMKHADGSVYGHCEN